MTFWKRNDRAELIRAYKRVFESEDGKQILNDLMKSCHILTSTMHENSHELAHNEGARSVVLRILRTLNINASELERIMNEQK